MPPASLTWSALTSAVKAAISVCSSPIRERFIKPIAFANARSGFEVLQSKLAQLHVQARHVLIGLEAASRYGENLYQFLEGQGYQLCLLHPRQTHQFAKAARLARKNRSVRCYHHCPGLTRAGEARRGYVATEVIATSSGMSPPAYAPLR
jgi:transposase